jgi:hypothetical protein
VELRVEVGTTIIVPKLQRGKTPPSVFAVGAHVARQCDRTRTRGAVTVVAARQTGRGLSLCVAPLQRHQSLLMRGSGTYSGDQILDDYCFEATCGRAGATIHT